MGIAPTGMPGNSLRVEFCDIEAPKIRSLIVDEGKFAVITTVEQPGFSPLPGVAPRKSNARCLQAVS